MPQAIGLPTTDQQLDAVGAPSWLKPENASVLDPPWRAPMRNALQILRVLTGADDPKTQMIAGAALENPQAVGGALEALGEKFPRLAKVIKAYHGSPHDFEQFSTAKIGTGEGAQAYGHGLYFAENPAVAKDYQKALSPQDRYVLNVNGQRVSFRDAAKQALGDKTGGDLATYYETGDATRRAQMEQMPVLSGIGSKLKEMGHTVEYTPTGRMYEVAIKADPDHFLDWDKPLSQQSEKVRQALGSDLQREEFVAQAGKRLVDYSGDTLLGIKLQGELRKNGGNIHAALDTLSSLGNETWKAKVAGAKQLDWSGLTSQMVDSPGRGQDLVSDYMRRMGGPEKASAYLKDKGVPGIKYLDQGSRTAGEGSRNYVVFDDQLVDIMKKYGWLLPAAGVGAASAKETK